MSFVADRDALTPEFLEHVVGPVLPNPGAGRLLPAGWASHAVDFGPHIVRFPVDEGALVSLALEETVCARLPELPLATPRPTLVRGEFPFSWHEKIPGEALHPRDWNALPSAGRERIARQLVPLFTWLHARSREQIAAWDVGRREPLPDSQRLRDAANDLPRILREFARRALDEHGSVPTGGGELVLGHFDAHGSNMAFDRGADRLVGIYDFGDLALGDLHHEFRPLHYVSPDLTERVITAYERESGRAVDRSRVRALAVLVELADFTEAHEGRTPTKPEHHVRQLRRWQQEFAT